jgi:hypothetical protein
MTSVLHGKLSTPASVSHFPSIHVSIQIPQTKTNSLTRQVRQFEPQADRMLRRYPDPFPFGSNQPEAIHNIQFGQSLAKEGGDGM